MVAFLFISLAFAAPSLFACPAEASPQAAPAGPAHEFNLPIPAAGGQSWTVARTLLPGYTIRHTVPEVRVQFTVADDHGRLLQSLSSSDFRVLDNRDAVPKIRSFSRLNDLPLQIGILLDVSDSVQKTSAREKTAVEYFVQHVLRPQTDRAALLAFSSEVGVWQRSTGDRDALQISLTHVHQPGNASFLYDGVYGACTEQFSPAGDGDTAQRILVLITDGDDTGSLHSLGDAISAAQHRDIQIFALSVHSRRAIDDGDEILRRMADETGGQSYIANSEKDFPAVFAAMEQQMRTQYSVSFQPVEQTPGFHAVKIETAGGRTLHVRSRPGYFYDAP